MVKEQKGFWERFKDIKKMSEDEIKIGLLANLFKWDTQYEGTEVLSVFLEKPIKYYMAISPKFCKHLEEMSEYVINDNGKKGKYLQLIDLFLKYTPFDTEEKILHKEIVNLLFAIPCANLKCTDQAANLLLDSQLEWEPFWNDKTLVKDTKKLLKKFNTTINNNSYIYEATNNGLLASCLTYRPWLKRNGGEEFLTQAFSYCLNPRIFPTFYEKIIKLLKDCYKRVNKTLEQFPVVEGITITPEKPDSNGNRMDIAISSLTDDGGNNIKIILENKVTAYFDPVQMLRYCAHEDSPVVFAITYKNDCDEEGFKELIGSKTKIRELLEHHQKIKEKKIILDNIDRINPSNWGGHLFWDDILKVVKDALALSANPHSEKEEEIYLRYFESLIEDLYYGYDENIPGLEMIENIDNEKGTTNGFRRYILDQFGEYFFKSNACERLKKKIDNLDELYDIKIDKETKGQTGWNSNDVNGTKSFHLLIKPKVNLDIFNGGRPKVGVPYSSIQIWFCIKNSKYIHEKNNDGELITKFVAHRLDIQFALNVYQIVNEDIKEWKKKIKNNPEIKKGRMHEGEFKKIKNDSGIEEPRIKKLDIVVPVESESMTIGEISAVYPADDWRESVLLFLKKTLLDWENKGHFKKLIEWWGDDLLTDDKINTNK